MKSKRRWSTLGAVGAIVGLAIGTFVWVGPARRVEASPHLPPATRLSESARAALATQMRAHAGGMTELTSAVTVLDYDAVAAAARRLLGEPRVARPLSNDAGELNSQLPARFFALQDQLRTDLGQVADAASARSAEKLADSFAATTKTCIRCHETYRNGR